MTAEALLTSLRRRGAEFAPLPGGALKVTAPRGTLTPAVLQALQAHKAAILGLLTWNQAHTEQILRATVARVAGQYRPGWRTRYLADASRWLEVEGRIEAAFLVRDMPALLRALAAYEVFAQQTFEVWAQQEQRR